MTIQPSDISTTVMYYDANNVLQTYDSNNPPSPMPGINSFYLQVSWTGNTPYFIPGWWNVDDINNTIQGDLNLFNNAAAAVTQQITALTDMKATLSADTVQQIASPALGQSVSS
jgi:hypothetical protein